ncbi:ABC transporter permease [Enteractinococcus coprophilus]|uniref:Putative ABC transport system permease protein n=1 Tax=Enteractinococcus coprophilus TaxID=1027633 RepID=A0A543AFJ5_9MICC|nr:ABC transporter permease [Enteractinococcus coprophilus]TQL71344.1 putative ABC transport system permease protein [Enteractinococcus coprophilus]
MKLRDIFTTALANTMRTKLRTFLTVIAVVIGAFTLTMTSGIGAGINKYIDAQVDAMGDTNQVSVMPAQTMDANVGLTAGEPQEYDPDAQGTVSDFGIPSMDEEDIEEIEQIENIEFVDPVIFVDIEYLETPDGTRYTVPSAGFASEQSMVEYAAGGPGSNAEDAYELVIPTSWLSAFDIDDVANADDVIDQEVIITAQDLEGNAETIEATVVGVAEETITGAGTSPIPSFGLTQQIAEINNTAGGTTIPFTYIQAMATVHDLATNEAQIKADLEEIDMVGQTVEDQMGFIGGIIDAITWVFNGFALIALLAASFGIVNTLLISVQERTRQIGLYKALGMTSGKVFTLFSTEAIVIGLLGSVIGIGLGSVVGVVGNALLINGPLDSVPGLTLYAIEPLALLVIALVIIGIAFLAGTLPARRAATKDPIEALRYD